MGNLFHLFDIQEDLTSRKGITHKSHKGGMEAPRNSLDLPMEALYGLCMRDNILFANTMESPCKDYYSLEAPMKKLISEEITKRPNTRQNGPSVVARLMGVDTLPFDSKPAQQLIQTKNESSSVKLMDNEKSKKGSTGHVHSTGQLESGSFGHSMDKHGNQHKKSNKPKPREHPQEEELQKFKKEFEAWQAARFKECSNAVEFTSDPTQLIAQEDLNREKMLLYSNSKRTPNSERLRDPKDVAQLASPQERLSFRSCKNKHFAFSVEEKESPYSNVMSRTETRASQLLHSDQKLDIISAPTKIVVLRPGPDRMDNYEDSWSTTPSTSEDRGRIEDFLEEVKERLKSELQGKNSKWSTTVRGGGIETPYREKPSEPRERSQHRAQHVRESVTKDFEMDLFRSEFTRSYRSDIQLSEAGSPEFINRDTRKFLAERLKNVMRGETVRPQVRYKSRLSLSDYDKGRNANSRDLWIENKMSDSDNFTNDEMEKSRSFRQEDSPRNLIRSLSAPVSAASFGKLLLEDRHVLTGAQIRRKHEVGEKVSMNIKKHRKDRFNLREKVSSFRYSLTLRGRLFRRRVNKSLVEAGQHEKNLLKDINSGPTVMMSFYDTHENSTEVPPSPASVCSSIHEEFWRQADYLSPMSSSSGVFQPEDSEMPNVFREINSNLTELRRKLNQLEGAIPEETTNEEQTSELETEIEDEDEAYIRDLLSASGLYDGSYSQSLSKWDPLGKPISNNVFEEVEEAHSQRINERPKDDLQGEKMNHKMILDLLNEVLPSLLRQPLNVSRYLEKAIGPLYKPPHGRKLLSQVWKTVGVYVHPPADIKYYTLDHMLTRDLETNPWSRIVDDDINAVGREIERLIIEDLIEEIVKCM